MKTSTKLILPIFLCVLMITKICTGQDNYASNIRTMISDDRRMYIQYDIIVNDGSKYFHVILELMYMGELITPNKNNLTGTFGHAVPPGNKTIIWNFADEFDKDINEVKVNVYAIKEKEPKAKFIIEPTSCYAPCEVKFTNHSENSDRFEWNFADSGSGIENTSFEEHPTHIFKTGGSYIVELKAFNTNLGLDDSAKGTIIVSKHEPVVADFEVVGYDNLSKKKVPTTIEFLNISSENADSYLWIFGDPGSGKKNNTSAVKDPVHKYKRSGTYTVQLTAKSTFSGLESTKSMDIFLPEKEQRTAKPPVISGSSAYEKHKQRKTIFIVATAATAGLGTGLYLKSNSLYDEYQTATEDPGDLLKKSNTYKTMALISYGVSVVCAVEIVIQAKKQSDAKKQLSLQALPLNNGGMIMLTYNF